MSDVSSFPSLAVFSSENAKRNDTAGDGIRSLEATDGR